MFGWFVSSFIGLWIALFVFKFYRRPIQRHVRTLLEYNQEFKLEHQIKHTHNIYYFCYRVFVIWIILILGLNILNLIISSGNQIPTKWIENIIANCQRLANLPDGQIGKISESSIWTNLRLNDMFYRYVFVQSGSVSAVIGAYFGICLDAIYLGGSPQDINYTKSPLKAIGRFVLVMLFWFVPIYFSGKAVRK